MKGGSAYNGVMKLSVNALLQSGDYGIVLDSNGQYVLRNAKSSVEYPIQSMGVSNLLSTPIVKIQNPQNEAQSNLLKQYQTRFQSSNIIKGASQGLLGVAAIPKFLARYQIDKLVKRGMEDLPNTSNRSARAQAITKKYFNTKKLTLETIKDVSGAGAVYTVVGRAFGKVLKPNKMSSSDIYVKPTRTYRGSFKHRKHT